MVEQYRFYYTRFALEVQHFLLCATASVDKKWSSGQRFQRVRYFFIMFCESVFCNRSVSSKQQLSKLDARWLFLREHIHKIKVHPHPPSYPTDKLCFAQEVPWHKGNIKKKITFHMNICTIALSSLCKDDLVRSKTPIRCREDAPN